MYIRLWPETTLLALEMKLIEQNNGYYNTLNQPKLCNVLEYKISQKDEYDL